MGVARSAWNEGETNDEHDREGRQIVFVAFQLVKHILTHPMSVVSLMCNL